MSCASDFAKKSPCWKAVTSKPPPALHVLTKQKLSLSPSQGPPSSYTPPPPIPTRTQKKKVPLELVFFFFLITHCTEITFPLLTISEPIF